MEIHKEYEDILREQLARVAKAVDTAMGIVGPGVDGDLAEEKKALCEAEAEMIAEYAQALERKEKELIAELQKAIIYYGGKIAATQTLLRQLGRDEQKMLNIKSALRSEEMKELREKCRI